MDRDIAHRSLTFTHFVPGPRPPFMGNPNHNFTAKPNIPLTTATSLWYNTRSR